MINKYHNFQQISHACKYQLNSMAKHADMKKILAFPNNDLDKNLKWRNSLTTSIFTFPDIQIICNKQVICLHSK